MKNNLIIFVMMCIYKVFKISGSIFRYFKVTISFSFGLEPFINTLVSKSLHGNFIFAGE